MGIVEAELADFELSDGTRCRIELNRNNRIHLHVGRYRADLTLEEFEQFATVTRQAEQRLTQVKDLD